MVTIISEDKDKSTDNVIEWLVVQKTNFKRINFKNFSKISIVLNDKSLQITNENFIPTKIWFRRGRLQLVPKELIQSSFYDYLRKEERVIIEFHEKILKDLIPVIGSYQEEVLNNKILNLSLARDCGLGVPNTIITNSKKELSNFKNLNTQIISKSIFHPPNFRRGEISYSPIGTFLVNKKDIDFLDEVFSPTLYQELIIKKYEVRVFFFEENFYSMAIFSQNDIKTKIDFRNYNKEKPNRTIPFNLPKNVKNKIQKFITRKQINTGSIDLIVTPNNDFVFLEINPQGQFHWLSENCNYYIDQAIAMNLSK